MGEEDERGEAPTEGIYCQHDLPTVGGDGHHVAEVVFVSSLHPTRSPSTLSSFAGSHSAQSTKEREAGPTSGRVLSIGMV